MKRGFALLGICALSVAALAPAAAADPTNAKNATQLELDCNGTPYQVVVNGNGKFTPAHILDSTGVIVIAIIASWKSMRVDTYNMPATVKAAVTAGMTP